MRRCFLKAHGRLGACACVISGQRAPSWNEGTRVRLAASRELHSYWNLLRGGRSAPERSEIDPSAIRGVLADTFILEVDSFRRYPFRIAGTRTNSLFGRELKGEAFLDLWQESEQREIAAIVASVADEATAVLAGAATRPQGTQRARLRTPSAAASPSRQPAGAHPRRHFAGLTAQLGWPVASDANEAIVAEGAGAREVSLWRRGLPRRRGTNMSRRPNSAGCRPSIAADIFLCFRTRPTAAEWPEMRSGGNRPLTQKTIWSLG